jgi:hypothetical protein
MRNLVFLAVFVLCSAQAAVTLDPSFWDDYQPYQQYSDAVISDLIALREGDLLETASSIDGLELRIVGRDAPGAMLISVRVVIDSVARQRLQAKTIPFDLAQSGRAKPTLQRRPLRDDEAQALTEMLETTHFWDAPYSLETVERDAVLQNACEEGNGWIVEAVRPGAYQLISRANCEGLDPSVAAIRDLLLAIAGISAAGPD